MVLLRVARVGEGWVRAGVAGGDPADQAPVGLAEAVRRDGGAAGAGPLPHAVAADPAHRARGVDADVAGADDEHAAALGDVVRERLDAGRADGGEAGEPAHREGAADREGVRVEVPIDFVGAARGGQEGARLVESALFQAVSDPSENFRLRTASWEVGLCRCNARAIVDTARDLRSSGTFGESKGFLNEMDS